MLQPDQVWLDAKQGRVARQQAGSPAFSLPGWAASMKTIFRVLSWIVLAALPAAVAFAAPVAQVVQSSGYVTLSSPQMAPKTAKGGTGVEVGNILTTGSNGTAVLKFQDGQVIALQPDSVFRVNDFQYDLAAPEKGVSFLSLLQGGLRAITGLIGDRNPRSWKVATPTATAGIRGTDFMLVIRQGLYAQVNTGAITLTNDAGVAALAAGETGFVSTGATLGTVIPASAAPAGIFTPLQSINLGAALGGSAAGAGGAAGAGFMGMPASVVIGVGAAAAVGVAAVGGGDDAQAVPTTTHH